MRSLMGLQMGALCVDFFAPEKLTLVYSSSRIGTVVLLSL